LCTTSTRNRSCSTGCEKLLSVFIVISMDGGTHLKTRKLEGNENNRRTFMAKG
jgi:hypothetical protein